MKTAWFLTHRIREMMKRDDDLFSPPTGGAGKVVEADETFVGRKPGTKVRHGAAQMNAVLSLVERGGEVRSFHVPNVRSHTLRTIIGIHAAKDSRFMTDEAGVYRGIGWNFAEHGTINHKLDEYVRGDVYTNTIEGYFSILKRDVCGVYQHVSEAHLHRYLAEFDFRYTYRTARGVEDEERASLVVYGAKGRRLTYRTPRSQWRAEAATL